MNDYHVHLHPHGRYAGIGPPPGEYPAGYIESFVERASERGVEEICFTEHLYRCHESIELLGHFWEDRDTPDDVVAESRQFVEDDLTLSLDRYVEAVVDAKDQGLPVLLGLEVDFFPETFDAVVDFLEPYPWDLLIGSVHWLGGWLLDHVPADHEFERRGIDRAYEDYFRLETDLASTGSVDVLAHVDKLKGTGHQPEQPPVHLFEEVIKAASMSGTAVEINTSGLRKPCRELFPNDTFLEMSHAAGIQITLGSDAHRPDDAGLSIDAAAAAARRAGYTHHLRFRDRVSSVVELPED